MLKKEQSNEKKNILLFCIKRRAPIKDQPDRVIQIGTPDIEVPNNSVETTKYNLVTFFPKNLMQQISKSANLYFFIMGLWQMVPQITTTGGLPFVYMPLSLIITISMIKDFIEDRRRRTEDTKENNRCVEILVDGKFIEKKSKNVHIGDIIKIKEDEYFCADVVLLQVPENKNMAYIETKNLDGETNLKPILVHSYFQQNFVCEAAFQEKQIMFKYEKPSLMMYNFNGFFQCNQDQKKHSVDINNFICRGSSLKNIPWILGVVTYSGHDSKIMLNSISGKYKISKIERQMNKQIIYIFLLLSLFSLFSAIYSTIWQENHQELINYSDIEDDSWNVFLLRVPQWLLLLSNFVPISLLVTIEMVKFGQSLIVSSDINFKHNGMKAIVNSSNLIEQLGQVNFIFSDKTGTLTSNLMRFKSLSAGYSHYGHRSMEQQEDVIQEENEDQEKEINVVDFHDMDFLKHFKNKNHPNHKYIVECLNCINLCHTIHTEIKNDAIKYVAQSPDEFALINFAYQQHYQYQGRDENDIMFIRDDDQVYQYKLLNTLEFSYERKRMSVIVKNLRTNEIIVYTKGADQIIYQLLKRENQQKLIHKTTEILAEFSQQGLRTLCLSRKVLEEEEYHQWLERYQKANQSLQADRKIEIERLQKEIETDSELLGSTAIEDKLQDKIAETMDYFKVAGIQTWMLTGDKIETAINIGRNCSLIDNDGEIIILDNEKTLKENFEKCQQLTCYLKEKGNLVVVVSGNGFQQIKSMNKLPEFQKILLKCETVLGCRVTPKEKQEFVCLIKQACPKAITLAIGDGANDVSMITEAHVGIGIQGIEGREATKASDFAIGEFRHLKRLLFYTGQEAYRRNSNLIFFNFYKNQSWILTTFFYGFYSGFSGQYLYDQVMQQFFNLFFAALPIVLYAFFDEMYPTDEYLSFPQEKPNLLEVLPLKYLQNCEEQIFCLRNFWVFFVKGAAHSCIITLVGIYSFSPTSPFEDGYDHDFYMIGMFVYSLAVIINNIKVLLMHETHYGFTIFLNFGSTILYFAFFFTVSENKHSDSNQQFARILASRNALFGLLVTLVLTSLFDYGYEQYRQKFMQNEKYNKKITVAQQIRQQSLLNSLHESESPLRFKASSKLQGILESPSKQKDQESIRKNLDTMMENASKVQCNQSEINSSIANQSNQIQFQSQNFNNNNSNGNSVNIPLKQNTYEQNRNKEDSLTQASGHINGINGSHSAFFDMKQQSQQKQNQHNQNIKNKGDDDINIEDMEVEKEKTVFSNIESEKDQQYNDNNNNTKNDENSQNKRGTQHINKNGIQILVNNFSQNTDQQQKDEEEDDDSKIDTLLENGVNDEKIKHNNINIQNSDMKIMNSSNNNSGGSIQNHNTFKIQGSPSLHSNYKVLNSNNNSGTHSYQNSQRSPQIKSCEFLLENGLKSNNNNSIQSNQQQNKSKFSLNDRKDSINSDILYINNTNNNNSIYSQKQNSSKYNNNSNSNYIITEDNNDNNQVQTPIKNKNNNNNDNNGDGKNRSISAFPVLQQQQQVEEKSNSLFSDNNLNPNNINNQNENNLEIIKNAPIQVINDDEFIDNEQ